jgi:histidyl-tRNA synthetase
LLKAPRGTTDLLPEEQKHWQHIKEKCAALSQSCGYSRLDTPVFESSGLFHRSVGEGTDIIEKETYTFQDRGGDMMTLRPEGTAPVCRSYLEHGMQNLPQPVRLFYFCPVFRYDRPQAGRYREHHQFGVEVLGDGDPMVDAEVVDLAWRLMADLQLSGLTLLINSVGDSQCRPAYVSKLKTYYYEHKGQLCSDCLSRLERNPLRLLDCKQDYCRQLSREAPHSIDNLCHPCQDHWAQLQHYLSCLNVPHQVDHRLVRGLDYYTRTVFEIQPHGGGAQSTICGGGRYDGLIEQLGGKHTPGIGFATGIERLILNLKRQNVDVAAEETPNYLVVSVGDSTRGMALEIAGLIRGLGKSATIGSSARSLKGQLRQANALSIPFVIILGEDECATNSVSIRDMTTGEQQTLSLSIFSAHVKGT